jgi:hypothetical protein
MAKAKGPRLVHVLRRHQIPAAQSCCSAGSPEYSKLRAHPFESLLLRFLSEFEAERFGELNNGQQRSRRLQVAAELSGLDVPRSQKSFWIIFECEPSAANFHTLLG